MKDLKRLTRTWGVKVFMKSQRKVKTNVSEEFLELIRHYAHKLLKNEIDFSNFNSDGKVLCLYKKPLLDRKEVQKVIGKAEMSKGYWLNLNYHIAHICASSVKAIGTDTTVKVLVNSKSVVVKPGFVIEGTKTGRFSSQTENESNIPQILDDIPVVEVGTKISHEIPFTVTIQGVSFDGTYRVRSGYKPKKLAQSVENSIVRQFALIGIHEKPVVELQTKGV